MPSRSPGIIRKKTSSGKTRYNCKKIPEVPHFGNFCRKGDKMVYYMEYPSPLGMLLLTAREEALTGLWMDRIPEDYWIKNEDKPVFQQTREWLDTYFQGEEPKVSVSLHPEGTDFQKMVWEILLTIPYGQTRTYGSIAREMADRLGKETMSAQAVGGAVGRNPISILIPCHRVVGTGGKLTGYASGLSRKEWLLKHERAI